jgi:RNA polymerase sigma factor (sigma-70 family)
MSQIRATISGPRSDGELLAEFAQDRREASFAEVVQRHGGMVLAVCRSVLGRTADAEDAAQAVFLTLARKAHRSSVQGHVAGWLHRVAWYVAARGADARAIRRRHEGEAARLANETQEAGNEVMNVAELHKGLAALPEKYRLPLILHHLEGRSHEETAALVGCSVNAVAVRLHRGREMLRKKMEVRGVAMSMAGLAGMWSGAGEASSAFVAGAAKVAASGGAAGSGQTMALANAAGRMLFWGRTRWVAGLLVLVVAGTVGVVVVSRGSKAVKPAEAVPPAAAVAPARPAGPKRVVTGLIRGVGANSITVQPQAGPAVTVALDGATVVKLNDRPATVADLKVDLSAGAFFEEGKPASEVRAYTPGTVPSR